MTTPEIRPVADALCAMLRTATGLTVGDSQVPSDTGTPYLIVYPLPMGVAVPTLGNPEDGAELHFQVSAIGRRRDQADLAVDKARAAIFVRAGSGAHVNAIAGAGFTVCGRTWVSYTPVSADLTLGLVTIAERFSLYVTWP